MIHLNNLKTVTQDTHYMPKLEEEVQAAGNSKVVSKLDLKDTTRFNFTRMIERRLHLLALIENRNLFKSQLICIMVLLY